LALTKAKESEAVKAYITRLEDIYRAPYERRISKLKRQCIFIGTTNKEQFLTDKTGNRRFYPVRINQSGYDLFSHKKEIKADILQCWAEAKFKFDKNEMPAFANRNIIDEIKKRQSDATEDDYRIGMIEDYLETMNKKEICIMELWKNALRNEFSKPTKKDSNDIALILQNMENWVKCEKPKRVAEFGLQRIWKNINVSVTLNDLKF